MEFKKIAHELTWISFLCSEMIATANYYGEPANISDFEWHIGYANRFITELAAIDKPETKILARKAKEVLDTTQIIAGNPKSRATKRLCGRIDRCLNVMERNLDKLAGGD